MGTIKFFFLPPIMALLFGCHKKHYESAGIIKFFHTGITVHTKCPLFISTKPIVIHLNNRQIADLVRIKKNAKRDTNITEFDKQLYIEINYDEVVTDSDTFLALDKFIVEHPEYFLNDKEKKTVSWQASYNVFVNNSKYSIHYQLMQKFFNDLRSNLNRQQLDRKVIQELYYLPM